MKLTDEPASTRKAMEMALAALDANQPTNYCMNGKGEKFPVTPDDPFKFDRNEAAIAELRKALEPAAPEPLGDSEGTATQVVAGLEPVALEYCGRCDKHTIPCNFDAVLYSAATVEALIAERDLLRAKLPDVAKRERECKTIDDWRMRAMHFESEWAGCSHAFNKRCGELDQQLVAMTQERDSFYMDYRMKCDVKTKALHEQLEAMVHKLAAAIESAEYAWKNTRVIDKSRMETEAKLAAMTQERDALQNMVLDVGGRLEAVTAERDDHKTTLSEALKLLSEANARGLSMSADYKEMMK